MLDSVPAEAAPGERFGLELYKLIAASAASDVALQDACRRVCEMLASDPHSVIDFVPLPTAGAQGLRFTIRILDDFRINFALAANDPDIRH